MFQEARQTLSFTWNAWETETLPAVLQDLTQMVLVVAAYSWGWYACSWFVESFDFLSPFPRRKSVESFVTIPKVCAAVSPVAVEEVHEASAVLATEPRPEDMRQQWLSLLEHHDVFHAAPGSWVDAASMVEQQDAACDGREADYADEEDVEDIYEVKVSSNHERRNHGFALLEHYGVFGASGGAWSESQVGSILPSIG